MKKLKDDEIKKIKDSLKPKLKKSVLRSARDNFYMMYEVLEDKINSNSWSEEDKQDVLKAFRDGCKDATKKACAVTIREFLKSVETIDFRDNEYCRCCFFNEFCSGSPDNRGEDQWHYNLCLIWNNIMKGPFDLKYIRERWIKVKNSDDLQKVHDLIEGW